MNLIELISILAFVDFILTGIWIYRWRLSKNVIKFKYQIPINLIESNPLLRITIKELGFTTGLLFGYSLLFLIQIALAKLHWILGLIVILILLWTIWNHHKNNLKTSNKQIIKITLAYNKKMRENKNG